MSGASMLEKYGPERPVIVESVRYVKVDGIDADFVEILFRNPIQTCLSTAFPSPRPAGRLRRHPAGSMERLLAPPIPYADSYYVPGYFDVVHPPAGEVLRRGV